jgi:hypothetical protein
MLELIKGSLLNPIQVSAEVNAALKGHTLVVVTKKEDADILDQPVYDIYACQGTLEGGQIKET